MSVRLSHAWGRRDELSLWLTGRVAIPLAGADTASIEDSYPLLVELGYDPRDPYAISASFGGKYWRFSRESLTEALNSGICVGVGDVRITSQPDALIRVDLSSPTGAASLWLDTPPVDDFLFASYALMPAGAEMRGVDWETEFLGGWAA